jgi:hypothetical protein
MKRILSVVFLFLIIGSAQVYHSFVTSTSAFDATAYNNSHKIATQMGEWMYDTIYIVYHSGDSIYIVASLDEGWTWQAPLYLYPGTCPALDVDQYGMRHIAWQQLDSVSGNYDVFYDCLEDYSPPVNVSQSAGNSVLPDVAIDSAMTAHIVWTEEHDSLSDVYYRGCLSGTLGDTVRLSGAGKNSSSSVSIFPPNHRVYVCWSCVDSASYTPYHILYRYKESDWSGINELAGHWKALRNPSFDFSRGTDSLSACWEDSTSDNLEATFYGGNQGGGYPTAGRSTYPVISTVWTTYSYYFWQEDSAGYEDIYCHLYYEMSGWYMEGSLREYFMITEPIRFPNVCGAYLTWTQGNSPSYEVWFACFGYPIGIDEVGDRGQQSDINQIKICPNPFSTLTKISVGIEHGAKSKGRKTPCTKPHAPCLKIYDATGRVVRSFSLGPLPYALSILWEGKDDAGREVAPGIYFVSIPGYAQLAKVVKLR